MLPHVILHNSISADGRVDWFPADVGLHYEVAGRLGADTHLAGSDTLLSTNEPIPPEDESAFQPPAHDPADTRSILAVPDSRGRVRFWHALRQYPFWRDFVALCSQSTPSDYLDYLRQRHIGCIVAGQDHVDMRCALEELNATYGSKTVLLDSGGTLNGVLLREGLVDEVSLLIHPHLVGGVAPRSFFRAPELTNANGVIGLRLVHVEQLKDEIIWLRYQVTQ